MDTESIIREALGLLGEMAKSPEQLAIAVSTLGEEKLDELAKLIGEVEHANEHGLIDSCNNILSLAEETDAIRSFLPGERGYGSVNHQKFVNLSEEEAQRWVDSQKPGILNAMNNVGKYLDPKATDTEISSQEQSDAK